MTKLAIIFDSDLASRLASNEMRLPPTYIGCRRVRPSSKAVLNALKGVDAEIDQSEAVFKVVDPETGRERRMNSQEKKAHKIKLRNEKQQAKREGKAISDSTQLLDSKTFRNVKRKQAEDQEEIESENVNGRYLQLHIDPKIIEQELADLRGERDGVPPVALSYAMMQQGIRRGLIPNREALSTTNRPVVWDEALAREWASRLSVHLEPAHAVRTQEDLRPLVYVTSPEVWTRFRPTWEVRDEECSHAHLFNEKSSSLVEIRTAKAGSTYDNDSDAVVHFLYNNTSIHIACGAKFGCDFLLYDGPRGERHAFAALRILNGTSESRFPLPTAYDMAGYVRCMNTAGKLALIATVRREKEFDSVAIVDLTLQRVETDNVIKRRLKRKTIEQRYENLSKKK